MLNIIFSYLNQNSKKSLKILDYGCGVGTVDFFLAKNGYKVHGIDVSPTAINLCKKSVEVMKLKNINFSTNIKNIGKNRYDMVICSEVIEHVKDDRKVLLSVLSALKKDGYLILSTPSLNAPLFKLGLANGFDKRVGHLRRYTEKDLIEKVERAGFKIVKIIKTEGIIRNSLFLFPILGNLVRFIKGPISDIVTFVDGISLKLFGESDICVICQRP